MVIVDSSVWIDLLRGWDTPETATFERLAVDQEIALGDLILYEILQGVKPVERTEKVKSRLLRYHVYTMGGQALALEAVHNSQFLRSRGVQVHPIDCLIATFCIVSGSRLLSSDHHFQWFAEHLGLVMAS